MYAVNTIAGHQASAESWEPVALCPESPVAGGGTQRSGQAAFGMCRGGRMFAPTKVWRKYTARLT